LKRNGRRRAFIAGPEQTHKHFKAGIAAIANLLAPTFGPIGGVIINDRDRTRMPELLDDSATAVRRILSLGDPRLDVGAMLMRSLVWRVTGRVGDGGAMTGILTRAIYEDALRLVTAGASPVWISNGVRTAIEAVIEQLQAQSVPIATEDELTAVAYTIVKERPLAAMVGELSYMLGPDGRVNVEKYVAPYLERTYYPGANYDAQIGSYHLYTDQPRKQAIHTDCAVAIVETPLQTAEEVVNLMERALEKGKKALVIIAHSFKDTALHTMVRNQQAEKRKLSIVGATLKAVGDERRSALSDLALLTGAEVLGRNFTHSAQAAKVDDLGSAMRVEIDAKTLQILPEQTKNAEIQKEIALIRSQLDQLPQSDEERPKLIKRLSALTGGMGTLKVGASTKTERSVRAENAERAIKVLSAAQKSGVVPGGGAAFIHALEALPSLSLKNDEEALGVQLVKRALQAPLRQIAQNACVDSPAGVVERVRLAGPQAAYDALSNQVVNAHEAGVLDVTDILIAVLQTASSGALMALSTDTIVYHRKPKESMEP
jgi:chaperonin GroEL